MRGIHSKALLATVVAREAARRFLDDKRGLTVSAVILIGFLVVAVAAFGAIAARVIGDAGTAVDNVDFNTPAPAAP